MTSKKILVVSSSFYPQLSPRSFRTTELVKEMARQGHQVTLYTLKDAAVLQDELAKQMGFTIKDLGKLHYPKINIDHANRWVSLFKRALNRAMLMLFEYPDIELFFKVKHALKNENGYELLISIAVPFPVHWGAAKALSKNKQLTKTWVADCGDPYMGNKADSFKKLFYFKYIEKWFCRTADYLTVPTTDSVPGYYPEFHTKIKVIPQGFNFDDTPVYTGTIKNEVPTFAYAGAFIAGIRDPRELLELLVQYPKPYKFIIYTNHTHLVEPYIQPSANRIELRQYIPRKELLFELSKMDFLINFTNSNAVQTPSKLIDYAIAKRPVLSVDTGKPDAVTLDEFLNGNYSRQFSTGNIEQYNIKNVASRFIELSR
jgi:Glycosyltransferase Family 4